MANTLFNQTSSNIKVSIGGSGGIENATSSNNITLTSSIIIKYVTYNI